MSPKLFIAGHLLQISRVNCSTGVVLQQQSFCRKNCCESVEQRVSCWKMSEENNDHARRRVGRYW